MSNALLYVTAVLIWGSTWLAINFQLGPVAPEVSLVYRYLIAAGLLFAWCLARGLRLRFDLRSHAWFLVLGVFLFGVNYLLAYYAQFYITSALNAVLFTSIVWMNIFNTRLFFATRASAAVYLGAALGVVGVAVLFAPQLTGIALDGRTLTGAGLSLTGALVASLGNMASQKAHNLSLPVVQSNAWGILYAGVLLALYALVRGVPFNFDFSPAYVLSLLYLAVFGSAIAFGAYVTLLGRIGAHRAVYVVVAFPVVAVVLSALFEDMRFDAWTLAGIALILCGNAFVLSRRAH